MKEEFKELTPEQEAGLNSRTRLILENLRAKLGRRGLITRSEFRELIGVGATTEQKMFAAGDYPPSVQVGTVIRIHIDSVALWLAKGGCKPPGKISSPAQGQKKRGRPVGSKNRPKEA